MPIVSELFLFTIMGVVPVLSPVTAVALPIVCHELVRLWGRDPDVLFSELFDELKVPGLEFVSTAWSFADLDDAERGRRFPSGEPSLILSSPSVGTPCSSRDSISLCLMSSRAMFRGR